MFAKRLDFIMKLTNTQNSVLARVAIVDASNISRFRSGKRKLPKNHDFLKLMCNYFARNIKDDYQRKTLSDIVCKGQAWPEKSETAAALLYCWLEDDDSNNIAVEQMLTAMSHVNFKVPSVAVNQIDKIVEAAKPYTYGHAGKREAVLAFLRAVISSNTPCTLLLYSDEPTDWLYEDVEFAKQWGLLLVDIIAAGSRIKIVHTINRSLHEMIDALSKWLPIYMTGAVEPYYCPKLRDDIYQRTLFVAPGVAAICSSTVARHTQEALNFLVTDQIAVNALTNEFNDYLALCRPLMLIFKNPDGNFQLTREYPESVEGETITAHQTLSLSTMPQGVAESIAARYHAEEFLKHWENSKKSFEHSTAHHTYVEIIQLPKTEDIKANSVHVMFSRLFGLPEMFYTYEEYCEHLKNLLWMSQINSHYSFCLIDDLIDGMMVYCRPEAGTVIVQNKQPTVFVLNEKRMTEAIAQYLRSLTVNADSGKKSAQCIEKFIEELKKNSCS